MVKQYLILIVIFLLAMVCGCFTRVQPTVEKNPGPETNNTLTPVEYTACGCGCCGGATPKDVCLYRAQGDDMAKIMAADKAVASNQATCATVGCSLPIRYRYCDN